MEKQVLGASAAAELQQLLIDTESLTDFLAEVSRYAAATVGSGLSCGITLPDQHAHRSGRDHQ